MFQNGQYEEAAAVFESLGQYKDSAERAKGAKFTFAWTLAGEGKWAEAAIAYGKLGDYKNARIQSFRLWIEYMPQGNTIATDMGHTVGLRTDDTVVAVGSNEYGECDVSDWTDIDWPIN